MQNGIEDPFLELLHRYRDAVHAKDVEAFLSIYDDDLHIFDAWNAWSLRGSYAWRAMAVVWFSSLGDERLVVDIEDARSSGGGIMRVGYAMLTYTAYSANGEKLRWLNNRFTAALRKTGRGWKIIHEHTSMPIEGGSLKAILQREGLEEGTPCH